MISAIFLNLFLILHLLKQVFKLVLMKKTRNKFIPIKLQSSWQSNVYLKEYEKNKGLFCYINRCCIFIYYARKQKTNTNTKLYPSKFTPIINTLNVKTLRHRVSCFMNTEITKQTEHFVSFVLFVF